MSNTEYARGASSTQSDVIVIGAGLSGLHAASLLKTAGHSVRVLEARDRIGGRVHSVPIAPGIAADLGAQWIADRQTRMMTLAREHNIAFHPTYDRGAMLSVQGKQIKRVDHNHIPLGIVAKLDSYRILSRLEQISEEAMGAEAEKYDALSLQHFLEDVAWRKRAGNFIGGQLASSLCMAVDKVSVAEVVRQIATMGGIDAVFEADQYIVTGGSSQFAAVLSAGLDGDIVLNEPVYAIDQSATEVTVHTKHNTYHATSVILAVPPQLIVAIDFKPALPEARLSVLNQFIQGKVIKTLAIYDTAWWRSKGLSGTVSDQSGMFPFVVDNGASVTDVGMLATLSTADARDRVVEQATGSPGEAFASYAQRVIDKEAPAPIETLSLDWNAEPWSQGGYASRRSLGGWTTVPDLFSPFGKVFFAGTETADEWRSYMEGALQAAERAVAEVNAAGVASRTAVLQPA
ncbi:MAG: NAD(P)/FAD-dependent oxidoreductase [Deinococcota bacterium]